MTTTTITNEGGTKFDKDKPRTDLLDAEWLEEVAGIMGFGARKYAAHNWRSGISISRLLGAALRHLFAVVRGEDRDPESGYTHIGHLSCCAMFLYWTLKHKPELDDRWKSNQESPLKHIEATGKQFFAPEIKGLTQR